MVPTGAGDCARSLPALKSLDRPPLGGTVTMSGPPLTKTVSIYSVTTGWTGGGPRLVAHDKATGAELTSADLPGFAIGTPMTCAIEGKQYSALTGTSPAPEVLALIALTLP